MRHNWPFEPLTPLKYDAILADPPWRYKMRSKKGYKKSPESHYETMDIADIKALPVQDLASKNCLLFLWSTWPHLTQALEVMNAWEFKYITGGAWIKKTKHGKNAFGTGYVLRSSTEPYLIGKIGSPKVTSKSERNVIETDYSAIEARFREHSRKPDDMRMMIERLLPTAHCAELFARESWQGHDVWGNEMDKFTTDQDESDQKEAV